MALDLEKNQILDDYELFELYKNCLKGIVSKNKLNESLIAQLLYFANKEKMMAISHISEYLIWNPGTTFEYWIERSVNYRQANIIINWLSKSQDHMEPEQEPQQLKREKKLTTKHYVLAYIFDCNAMGNILPRGNKKVLESIGNELMGAGKGNTFYKVFNEIIVKDMNVEKSLSEIGGECWRKAVIELSKAPELVEQYLQSKQL